MTHEQLAARLMAGEPIADVRSLEPFVASADWKLQLRAVRALTRQPGEASSPEKLETLVRGVSQRPIALPIELLEALASHDDERAVSCLVNLTIDFPAKRAPWDVLMRRAPHAAVARLADLTGPQLFDLRESLDGPLGQALSEVSCPGLVSRISQLLGTADWFVERTLGRMKPSIVGPALLRAYQEGRYRHRRSSRLLARWGGPAAIAELANALSDPLREVRSLAAQALTEVREPAFATVRDLLEHGDPPAVEMAVDIVAKWRDVLAVPALRKLLQRSDAALLPKILLSLAQVAGADAEADVLPFTRAETRGLRRASVVALRLVATPASLHAIDELVDSGDVDAPSPNTSTLTTLGVDSSFDGFLGSAPSRADLVYAPAGGREPELPAVPGPPPLDDDCYFSVFAPEQVKTDSPFIVEVWCHSDDPWNFAPRNRPDGESVRSQGPVEVPAGALMSVSVSVPGFVATEESGTLWWRGRTGVVAFDLRSSPQALAGIHLGLARVALGGLTIASIRFTLELAAEASGKVDRTASVKKISSAFASYASENREEVLARIQGMQKVMPALDVFLDVMSLRSGEYWQRRLDEEIAQRDALFLFWSEAASRSTWVDHEWRHALALRGLEFIDPVPLDPPSVAPVPKELAALHFSDWTLHLKGNTTRA